MTYKLAAITLIATSLVVAPFAPAHADGWHHGGGYYHGGRGGGGLILGVVAVGAAITGAAVAIATAPFYAVSAVAAPHPVYATPAQAAYYSYPPAYYRPQPVTYNYAQPRYVYPAYYAYPQ